MSYWEAYWDSISAEYDSYVLSIIGQGIAGAGTMNVMSGQGAGIEENPSSVEMEEEIVVTGIKIKKSFEPLIMVPFNPNDGNPYQNEWDTITDHTPLFLRDDTDGDNIFDGILAADDPASIDYVADWVAANVADAILSKTDLQNREYGSIIYRDANGFVHATALQSGALAQPNTAPSLSLSAKDVGPASQVIGIIHNHPAAYLNSQEFHLNKFPSGGAGVQGKDWWIADFLVSKGTNADIFRHYVIGPDGVIREYGFSDRDYTSLGEEIPRGSNQ